MKSCSRDCFRFICKTGKEGRIGYIALLNSVIGTVYILHIFFFPEVRDGSRFSKYSISRFNYIILIRLCDYFLKVYPHWVF